MKHTIDIYEVEEVAVKYRIEIEVPDGKDLQEFLDEQVMEGDYIGDMISESGIPGKQTSSSLVLREVWDSDGNLVLEG